MLPALLASLAPDPSATISKIWTVFSKDIRSSSLKRQLFIYLDSPPSKEGYLPTSPAPPTGAPADASTRGKEHQSWEGTPFLQVLQWLLAAIWWPRQLLAQLPLLAQLQLQQEPRPGPLLLPGTPDTAQPISKHSIILTKNAWVHFHVETLQQHNVQKPHSPQKCKAGYLICRSLVHKCKPHHPIKEMMCYNFL